MADVLWADVSEWQVPVDDLYPHPVLSIRACDGTYRDKKFTVNYAWATKALDSGKLKALIVYAVFRPNWMETFNTVKDVIGTPHPGMAVMVDVESWGGQISGNQSTSINSLYWRLVDWIGNPNKVIGYGNTGDLNSLWPVKPTGIQLVVASYGHNVDYPGKLAHQFADDHDTPPFGPCDINSADGYTIDQFCTAIGIGSQPTHPPPPAPSPRPDLVPDMEYGQTSDEIKRLQAFTNRVYPSYSHLPVTGFYGDMTTAVIREFQHRMGIMDGDGRNVGSRTAAALWSAGFRG